MAEHLNYEAYLIMDKNKLEIFLFDINNFIILYENKTYFQNDLEFLDLNFLNKFLDENIFKIEKLINKFIKNIILIIDSDNISNIKIGIKKKNYQKKIKKENLENILTELKDLFKENYPERKIMHMLVNKYIFDGIKYSYLTTGLNCSELCLEVEFISISNNYTLEIEKILEKYQIKALKYIDDNYIKLFFKNMDITRADKIYRINIGINENEIALVPKNIKKLAFFERFFQLFS